MRRRSLRIFVLLLQAWFLNVVIPGHTRGQITVAGYRPDAKSCCGDCGGDDGESAAPKSGKSQPTSSDRAHCAVCYFAAGLDIAAPIITPPMRGSDSTWIEISPVSHPVEPLLILAYFGRAPPTSLV